MAEQDQASSNHPIQAEAEEQTTLSPSPASVPLDVEGHQERFGWTEAESTETATDDETVARQGRRRAVREPKTDRRFEPRKPRPHLFVTLSHWAMVVLITLSFVTGIRLSWSFQDSPFRSWSFLFEGIAPEGTLLGINLLTLHVVISFLMIGVIGIYVAYMFSSGASRRLRLSGQTFQRIRQGAFVRGLWWSKSALWASNLLVYWLGFVFVLVLVFTGLDIYRVDWGLSSFVGGYDVSRFLHSFIAYLWIPYTILHMALQWCFGRFWTIFKAQVYAPHIRAGLIGIALALPIAVGFYAFDKMPIALTAKQIPPDLLAPVLDGEANDAAWQYADTISVRTVKGANNAAGHVDVAMQALHDGQRVYFKFEWDDPEASYKRFPLLKTAGGWRVLETEKKWGDEDVYYEDKFSLYVTDVPGGSCADTCHLGVGPHAKRDQKHGLHYTNGEVGDVWHWKAVRTNYMHVYSTEPGYMDDQHFRPLDKPIPDEVKKRYKGGYHPDPKTGGGYKYNYVKLDADKPLSEARVQPLFLPQNLDIRPNADPTTSEAGFTWWLHEATSVPYSEELDTYPEGTLLPNIVTEPFRGDRADVRAKAAWHRGRWTLEVSRVLDTQSEYDVAFSTKRPVYLTLAPYNRSQTRHSEHIKPVRLTLEH